MFTVEVEVFSLFQLCTLVLHSHTQRTKSKKIKKGGSRHHVGNSLSKYERCVWYCKHLVLRDMKRRERELLSLNLGMLLASSLDREEAGKERESEKWSRCTCVHMIL